MYLSLMINNLLLVVQSTQCNCTFDFALLLEYFKVLLSFPTVTLIIAGLFLRLFNKEVRLLFTRMRNFEAGGAKFGFEEVANAVVEKAVEESLKPRQEAINNLPESVDKVKKLAELEQEATALKQKIKSVVLMGKPVGFHSHVEKFIEDYFQLNSSEIVAIGGLPDDYFDKLYEQVAIQDPIIVRWGKDRVIQFLSGYWVQYKILKELKNSSV